MDRKERRKSCCPTLENAFKYEWNWRNFGFSGVNYKLFPFAQWMWMDNYVYPIYRLFLGIGLVIYACVEIPIYDARSKRDNTENLYLTYVTNWSFLLYTLSSISFAIFCAFFNFKKGAKIPKWLAEMIWFFYGLSMNAVMVTSLVYWTAYGNPKYREFYQPISLVKHSLPACTVFLDAWINGLPTRLLHAIYPVIYGLIYAIFSYVYYGAGNIIPIYPVLDWSEPLKAAFACLVIIVFSVFMQLLLYLIYVNRVMISARAGGRGVAVVKEWWQKN